MEMLLPRFQGHYIDGTTESSSSSGGTVCFSALSCQKHGIKAPNWGDYTEIIVSENTAQGIILVVLGPEATSIAWI